LPGGAAENGTYGILRVNFAVLPAASYQLALAVLSE